MPDAQARDAIVVGAGIVGICAALSLLDKGFAVRVIDPDPPADGASSGNAGVISPWSCVPQTLPGLWKDVPKWLFDPEGPLALRWSHLPQLLPWLLRFFAAGTSKRLPAIADAMLTVNRPSVDLFHQLLAGTGHEDLVRDSLYLHLYRNPAGADLDKVQWRLRSERGVPLEVLRGGEIQEVEPEVSTDFAAAVVIRSQGRATDPGRLGKVLAAKAEERGARFLRGRVHRLAPGSGGCRLDTDRGEMSTGTVVLAAGAWSGLLLSPLGVKVPLEGERGYHMVFADPGVALTHSLMDAERKFVTSSMDMGVRSAGTAEFAALGAPPDYRRARVFERLAKRLLPNLNTTKKSEWMGTRPSMPDSVPCIGPVPGHPNIIGAFGHGHLGLTGAPMTGRMVASLAAGEPMNIDLKPFRLDRFN